MDVQHNRNLQHGTILIVTMWIALVLAAMLLVFARTMRVELLASANALAAAQAESVAQGARAFLIAQVAGTDGTSRPRQDVSCEAVPVGSGYFWLLRPSTDDGEAYARWNPLQTTIDLYRENAAKPEVIKLWKQVTKPPKKIKYKFFDDR